MKITATAQSKNESVNVEINIVVNHESTKSGLYESLERDIMASLLSNFLPQQITIAVDPKIELA